MVNDYRADDRPMCCWCGREYTDDAERTPYGDPGSLAATTRHGVCCRCAARLMSEMSERRSA
jgi:hypothetical protein